MTRPNAYILPPSPDASQTAWGGSKAWWLDHVWGAAWIRTNTKSGLVFIGNLGEGMNQYTQSHIYAEYHRHYLMIYSEDDLASVAQGGTARYNIQPTVSEIQFPTIDYTTSFYVNSPIATISTITSSSSDQLCGSSCSSSGALVTTTTAHGLSINSTISIRGTSSDSSYGGVWVVDTVPSSTQFRIKNANASGFFWSGTSATGGSVRYATEEPEHVLGMAYDDTTQKLYIAVSKQQGINNLDGKVVIHVYQVAS
jgi:hypothetical protein